MEQRLSLVTLGVADLERSTQFYEALGWQAHPGGEGVTVFPDRRPGRRALGGRSELAEDSAVVDSGGWGGVTLAQNVRDTRAEVDAVLAAAEQAGATIGRPGAATFWGGYSGIFVDPDGHPWEIAHNPGLGRSPTTAARCSIRRVTGAYAEQTATPATPRPTSLPSVNISVADLVVSVATAADAPGMVDVIHAAFGARPPLDPPSTAIEETPRRSRPSSPPAVGSTRPWTAGPPARSCCTRPGPTRAGDLAPGLGPPGLPASRHRHGDGRCGTGPRRRAGLRPVELFAREEIAELIAFWQHRGFVVDRPAPQRGDPGRSLPLAVDVPTAEQMQDLGVRLAGLLRPGDLVIASGDLGAGKTTLTQGIGRGLGQ